ncbi:MAG: membrane dipeptidase [Longicatena sp.]
MDIFDLHADIGYAIMKARNNSDTNSLKNVHLKKFQEGNISYICMASYFEGSESWEDMKLMITSLKEEIAQCEAIDLVENKAILENHNGHIKAILSVEGMCGIKENPISCITWLYEQGVRIASLTWNDENALATGVKGNPKRGLTTMGKIALRKMIDLNMIVDVSHANEQTFWDIMEEKDVRVMATHSNVRELCFHPRNLCQDQLLEIRAHGGLVGVVSAPCFIDSDKKDQDVAHLVKHIQYICELLGKEYVAIGFDFMDFYDGYENIYAKGLKDASQAQNIILEMQRQNFCAETIKDIAYCNALKFIKSVL